MPGHRILFILESPKERMEYVRFFEELGFLIDTASNTSNIDSCFQSTRPKIIIADIHALNLSPIKFLDKIEKNDASCQTIFLAKEPEIEHAISLIGHGALDYLIKPVKNEQLELTIERALSTNLSTNSSQANLSPTTQKVKIITQDTKTKNLLALAKRVAKSSASVLIQGESGTGKELFAKYIHEKSDRYNKPFIAINCAALPENLLESELFGHEKGAFTGAISRKSGKFELADKGTLFLDEITEMQIHLQAKLLRVLQERVVDRVGGIKPVDVDVRVIATTNKDVQEAVAKNEFREDLFYRLNTIPLIIPSLRDRINDIEILCKYFIKKYCKLDNKNVKGMTQQAMDMLKSQSFAGNIRELENIIHRAVILTDQEMILPKDFLLDNKVAQFEPTKEDALELNSLKEMEEKMIYKALDETQGNRTLAAKILGISVRTLRNKLNEYKTTQTKNL